MFEYHGWVTLRDAPELDDPDRAGDCLLNSTLSRVRRLIDLDTVQNDLQVAELSQANAAWHLRLSGYRNHRQQPVIDLWHKVAETAPASYGLLYVQDDEDPQAGNEWVAWTMRRGTVTREKDPFLSPVVPVVEDDSL